MTGTTLDAMARGGMYDLVGGGFHRYSVDERWLVPHFEKMLYDNALLAVVYLHAWRRFGDARYRRVAEQTIDYVLRELALEGGGFASAQDADTDGIEGLTFTWARGEGAPGRAAPAVRARPVRPSRRARRRRRGRGSSSFASSGRSRSRDDKAIASWNGLMLAALAECGPRRSTAPTGSTPPSASATSCSGRSRRPTAACTARGATASRRERATSPTTRTSRTGCSSCTSRPATCAGCVDAHRLATTRARPVRRRRDRRLLPGARRRRAAVAREERARRPSDAERQLDARLRPAALGPDLGRRRARAKRRSRCSASCATRSRAYRRRSAGRSSRSTSTSRRAARSRSPGRPTRRSPATALEPRPPHAT